jgi:CrcB protein
MVGICGGFTTFSSFSLQTLDLAREGQLLHAVANVTVSVVLCLASVTVGYAAAEYINANRSPV